MAIIIVIGLQWGDEGKGKIVDRLATVANAVVRFQGGNNAGHTIVLDGEDPYKLSVLPSSILHEHAISIIGNGVVLNCQSFIKELNMIKSRLAAKKITINDNNIIIADNVSLLLNSIYPETDQIQESIRGDKIGTTQKGIGPCYEDKIARRGLRLSDLSDVQNPEQNLENKVDNLLSYHNTFRQAFGHSLLNKEEVMAELEEIKKVLVPYSRPLWQLINKMAEDSSNKIIFEGAQGSMLDIDHGTYPFVTSSNTNAAEVCNGTGLSPEHFKKSFILGVIKAYTTRVGSGPFPTEQDNSEGELLQSIGNEFGTVSNRKRRCGWLDIPSIKKAVLLSGVNGLALTKIDVLDGFKQLKICSHYDDLGSPVYCELPGWNSKTAGITDYELLPDNAKAYVKSIEDLLNIPVIFISTGASRSAMLIKPGSSIPGFSLAEI